MTNEEKTELKNLLIAETNEINSEGILNIAKRANLGDKLQEKIGRVKELLEKI